jgi:hypothetical protein
LKIGLFPFCSEWRFFRLVETEGEDNILLAGLCREFSQNFSDILEQKIADIRTAVIDRDKNDRGSNELPQANRVSILIVKGYFKGNEKT